MKTEILLRITDLKFQKIQLYLKDLLSPTLKVTLINDTTLVEKYDLIFKKYEQILCLSDEIQIPPHLQAHSHRLFLSRVFDQKGLHVGWMAPWLRQGFIPIHEVFKKNLNTNYRFKTCIVDTDIATGSTRDFVLHYFKDCDFFAPIELQPHQDLIDIEDLFLPRSWMYENGQLKQVTYLENADFFSRRTSVDKKIFKELKALQISKMILESNY